MNNIYLLYNFNSYHNRVLKKFDTLTSYLSYQTNNSNQYDSITNANFDYRDGVTATCTYNLGAGFNYDNSPNYALVVDTNSNILSRWYVIDGVKTRGGQYLLTLLRDGIADYFNDIKQSPMYIEKGSLKLSDTPFIFNSEDIDFNQIKTSETLLKDKTGCPWIVGFMAQKQPDGISEPFTTQISTNIVGQVDATYNSMANYPYWNYLCDSLDSVYGVGNKFKYIDENEMIRFTLPVKRGALNEYYLIHYLYTPQSGLVYYTYEKSATSLTTAFRLKGTWGLYPEDNMNTIATTLGNTLDGSYMAGLARTIATTYGSNINSSSTAASFMSENGKLIRTNNSATNTTTNITYNADTYSIDINSPETTSLYSNSAIDANNTLNQYVITQLSNWINQDENRYLLQYDGNYSTIGINVYGKQLMMIALSYQITALSFTLDEDVRGLLDAPYRMFCLPYNDNTVKWFLGGTTYYSSNKNINMSIAQAISKTFSGTWLYDLQLVPYCPLLKYDSVVTVNNSGEVILNLSGLTNDVDYTNVDSGKSFILWCQTSQVDNYHINYNIPVAQSAIERKVKNQCDMYRLSSPSYNSIFEFNAERNGGVNYFDVDLVYKPYDSYIHINPNFGMLYGDDFNDARGLVFTGPFSLPQTTSAWQQYKLNNMNYQNLFDRQVSGENSYMRKMHEYDMKELGIKGITGSVTGAVSGATAGAVMGGGIGAIAGGILGAGASLVGSAADQQLATSRFKETINYTTDQFNMSLQNVQAQAQTISKVSAFTPNNKVFPILEYYTCTQGEKDAFRMKLQYNGMQINYITTISNLYNSFNNIGDRYTKGQLIRLNINEDNHLVEHISQELYKGVFI